jgi:hypothetical protein
MLQQKLFKVASGSILGNSCLLHPKWEITIGLPCRLTCSIGGFSDNPGMPKNPSAVGSKLVQEWTDVEQGRESYAPPGQYCIVGFTHSTIPFLFFLL